jgi:hypothetical protein
VIENPEPIRSSAMQSLVETSSIVGPIVAAIVVLTLFFKLLAWGAKRSACWVMVLASWAIGSSIELSLGVVSWAAVLSQGAIRST